MYDYDVLIIGAGPAGTRCAKDLSKAGKKVGIIEKDAVGGTCLNRGCIPLKAYLYSVELFESAKKAKRFGIEIPEVSFNWQDAKKAKDRSIKMLGLGSKKSLESAGVEIISGDGILTSEHEVLVKSNSEQTLTAEKIVLAVGTHSVFIPSIEKGEHVITSTEFLNLDDIPETMLIIGGGVTGVESASVFSSLGTKIIVVERQERILALQDKEVASVLHNSLKKKGCEIHIDTEVMSCHDKDDKAEVCFKKSDGTEETVLVDKALVSIGRRANYDLEELEKIGIKNDGKQVSLQEFLQTSLPNVYVIGDAAFRNLTAYGADREGETVAQHILGKDKKIDYNNLPVTIFSHPELAQVGLSEEVAKEKGIDYEVKKENYAANAKATIMGEREGMVKILVEKNSQKILGVHMVGIKATEMIHQALLPVAKGFTVEEWLEATWSHPVLSELIKTCLENSSQDA